MSFRIMPTSQFAEAMDIEAFCLSPWLGNLNEELRAFGLGALRAALHTQLTPQDAIRFMREGSAGLADGRPPPPPSAIVADPNPPSYYPAAFARASAVITVRSPSCAKNDK